MPSFYIEVYGCQMNVADSSELGSLLENIGWVKAHSPESADAIIINSCSVRKTAEIRVDGRIGFYKNMKKRRKFKLFLIGCYAQKDGKAIRKRFPFVDYVIGTRNRLKIPEILSASQKKNLADRIYTSLDNNYEEIKPAPDPQFPQRAFVSIIAGCDNFCSYCIVPYTRGREVSISSEEIFSQVKDLSKRGVSEIFLLGQNVNSYGKDSGDLSFAELLDKISEFNEIKRIRFMTSHPKDFSDELIDIVCRNKKIVRHIHLPLQSASNKILESMNRKYTYEHYKSIIDRIRSKAPDISFSTDILLGFPGETKEDFQKTYDAVSEIGYDKAFIFMYSPREGTKSESFLETVSQEEKQKRVQAVIDLQDEIGAKRLKAFIGKEVTVLVESQSKKDKDQMIGLCEYDFRVVFHGSSDDIGTFKKVRLKSISGKTLIAE